MRRISLLFVLLLMASFAGAEVTVSEDLKTSASGDFTVEVVAVENDILPAGTAKFNLKITNSENFSRRYSISPENTGEWLRIDRPMTGIDVEGGATEIAEVSLRAREETDYGTYFIKTTITNQDSSESLDVLMAVGIKTADQIAGVRVPDLRVSLDVPQQVDAREENKFKLYLLNKNNRDISGVVIDLESTLFGKKQFKTTLGPNEETEIEFDLVLSPLTEPQEDTIKGVVKVGGYTFTPTAKTFEVVSYDTQLNVEKEVDNKFFKSVKTISISNTGNTKIEDTIKEEKTFIKGLFTSTDPEARMVELNGIKYYSWPVLVNPEVSSEITITSNYRIILYIVIIVLALLGVKYMTIPQIRVRKKATGTQMKEGGISEMELLVSVQNKGGKPLKDIEIKETVPPIAEVKKEFAVGTMQPSKILSHKTKGTIIKWKVDELDSNEERIIKYGIKSKLNIIGSFTLPQTKVKYKTQRGGKGLALSNKLITGEEEK